MPAIHGCDLCDKVCKSKGGLKLHKARKHNVSSTTVTATAIDPDKENDKPVKFTRLLILNLVQKAANRVAESKTYSADMIKTAKTIDVYEDPKFEDESDLDRIIESCEHLCYKGNIEEFYSYFFGNIVRNSHIIFPHILHKHFSTLLCSKLADYIVTFYKDTVTSKDFPENYENIDAPDITIGERELGGLQYLGGYIIHKLHKKLCNSPSWNENNIQQITAMLKSCKCELEDLHSQKLISALNRGGLWGISKELEIILVEAEKTFRKNTMGVVREIDTISLIKCTMMSTAVNEHFLIICENCSIRCDKANQKITLKSILDLYFRVRSHSIARDMINKYKIQQTNSRKKGLRTDLKKLS